MKHQNTSLVFAAILFASFFMTGCEKDDETPTSTGGTKTGLFKSAGTFSFSSNQGNFIANGVFDTLMASSNASGAFKYTEGNRTFVMVFAYNVSSQTNMQVVFAGMADTASTTSTGTYSFNNSTGSKVGFFGYFPNLADTSSAAKFFVLTNGAMNVSSLTATAIAGTFSGTGVNVFDTLQTIALTNGTYNSPIVESYFAIDSGDDEMVNGRIREKIRETIRSRFMQK